LRISKRATLAGAAVVAVALAVAIVPTVASHEFSSSSTGKKHGTGAVSSTTKPRTVRPKPPSADGYFETLPPGAPLPTDAACAARVHHSAWEPRPQNKTANNTVVPQPVELPDNPAFDAAWQLAYKSRIDGNFTGTTDEIIQWASCKWGISDNLTRARAVDESEWHQSKVSDFEATTSGHCAPDSVPPTATFCPTSFGILQSKWYFRPGVYPGTRISTAFNLDSALAETRGCLDGLEFFGPISKGNLWGCVGVWFSGAWGVGDASYIANVQSIYTAKPWLSWKG
jgi:hypothetical protein